MTRFRLYSFEEASRLRYDVLGAPVERTNASLLRLEPLAGEQQIGDLKVGETCWCRCAVNEKEPARSRVKKEPAADRFIVERVA